MIRVSATLLEQFRLFTSADWMPESDLIDSIKGQLVTTPKMRIGRAAHYLMEHPQRNLQGLYEYDGLLFELPVMDSLLNRIDPNGVFESKIAKPIGTTREGDPLVLVAKADHIAGLHISEFKFPLDSPFDSEKYTASYQWRVMALIYEAVKVTYHVAQITLKDDLFQLKDVNSMNVFPYGHMEADVRHLIREFLSYARAKKLDEYLRREDRRAGAA